MIEMGFRCPVSVTLSLLQLTPSTLPLPHLLQLHAHLTTTGLHLHPPTLAKFIFALALSQNPHLLPYAGRVLTSSHRAPTVFALNSLIRAHSNSPTPLHSFHFYRQILLSHLRPDHFSLTFLARAAAHVPSPAAAFSAHAVALRRGLAVDPHVSTALIHAYAAHSLISSAQLLFSTLRNPDHVARTALLCALIAVGDEGARTLFDEMPHRDAVAWNAMLAGYSQSGRPKNTLSLFDDMLAEGARITDATLVPVLTACAALGALEQGRWVHAYIRANRLLMTVTMGTALIDMYSKCGEMALAMDVFWSMQERNVYAWSCAIGGLAMNGAGKECFELFKRMEGEGVIPNELTFTSVLHGCSVGGLVQEGREVFDSIRSRYGVEPTLQNYGCMVDLFARAGMLDDAVQFIERMPLVPHAEAWGALLNGCRIHGNTELGEFAARKIVELESGKDGAYVLLSNIYAGSKDWRGVSSVRKLMNTERVKKEVGSSAIAVDRGKGLTTLL